MHSSSLVIFMVLLWAISSRSMKFLRQDFRAECSAQVGSHKSEEEQKNLLPWPYMYIHRYMYKMTNGSPSSIVTTALQWVSQTGSPFSEDIMTSAHQIGISRSSVPPFFMTDAPNISQRRKMVLMVSSSQD